MFRLESQEASTAWARRSARTKFGPAPVSRTTFYTFQREDSRHHAQLENNISGQKKNFDSKDNAFSSLLISQGTSVEFPQMHRHYCLWNDDAHEKNPHIPSAYRALTAYHPFTVVILLVPPCDCAPLIHFVLKFSPTTITG